MRRLPTLIALLVTTLSIAACGGNGPQESGQAPPQEEQAAPATQSAPSEKNAPEENAPSESASQEESTQGGSEDARLSVTTLEGKQVAVGGQGDVTALYFMAGW